MKKLFFSFFAILLFASLMANAQLTPQQQQQQQVIKPKIKVEDLVFVYQALNSIDIKGNEVESFLNVKKFVENSIKKAQEDKKTATDILDLEVPLPLAQEMVNFLQRATFKGADADKFKRFFDALVEAAKALGPPKQ
jgi:hypothetical protein